MKPAVSGIGQGLTDRTVSIPLVTEESPDFSLVLGGPIFQLFRRSHLSAVFSLEELVMRIFKILF